MIINIYVYSLCRHTATLCSNTKRATYDSCKLTLDFIREAFTKKGAKLGTFAKPLLTPPPLKSWDALYGQRFYRVFEVSSL